MGRLGFGASIFQGGSFAQQQTETELPSLMLMQTQTALQALNHCTPSLYSAYATQWRSVACPAGIDAHAKWMLHVQAAWPCRGVKSLDACITSSRFFTCKREVRRRTINGAPSCTLLLWMKNLKQQKSSSCQLSIQIKLFDIAAVWPRFDFFMEIFGYPMATNLRPRVGAICGTLS